MKKGVYVGEFSEADIDAGKDRAALAEAQERTGLRYSNSELVRKNGIIVALRLWACNMEEMEVF